MGFICEFCGRENITHKKACCCCGESKGLGEFYRDRKRADGYRSECKECFRKNNKAGLVIDKASKFEELCNEHDKNMREVFRGGKYTPPEKREDIVIKNVIKTPEDAVKAVKKVEEKKEFGTKGFNICSLGKWVK